MFKKLVEAAVQSAPEIASDTAEIVVEETVKTGLSTAAKFGIAAGGIALLAAGVYGIVRLFSSSDEDESLVEREVTC
jgi:hypothetical protein